MEASSLHIKNIPFYKKIFTALIVVYPIFNRYASFLPMLTLSETFLFFFLIYAIFKSKLRPQLVFVPFILYLTFLIGYYTFSSSTGNTLDDNVGTMLRLLFLYVSITLLGKGFINVKLAIKWLNIVSILMVIYCILQWIAAKFGIYLTTYIPGLPIMAEDRDLYILEQQQKYGSTFRAYGLLNEPAALSVYLILPIIINLFCNIQIPSRIKKAAFLTLGCFICMSSTGILISILIWGVFIFFNKSPDIIVYKKYAILLVVISIIVLPYTEIWSTFMDRTFSGDIANFDIEKTTRFDAIGMLSIFFKDGKDLLLGAGMEYPGFYLPGFIRVIYNLGVLGFVIVLIQFFILYKKGNYFQRVLVLFYGILNIGTEILLGNFAIYYLPFILASKRDFE